MQYPAFQKRDAEDLLRVARPSSWRGDQIVTELHQCLRLCQASSPESAATRKHCVQTMAAPSGCAPASPIWQQRARHSPKVSRARSPTRAAQALRIPGAYLPTSRPPATLGAALSLIEPVIPLYFAHLPHISRSWVSRSVAHGVAPPTPIEDPLNSHSQHHRSDLRIAARTVLPAVASARRPA